MEFLLVGGGAAVSGHVRRSVSGHGRVDLAGPGVDPTLQVDHVDVAALHEEVRHLQAAAAVVTDLGGVLSHGAIVAREYGIPAVVNTRHATARIRTGQTVTVDGTAGTVRIAD